MFTGLVQHVGMVLEARTTPAGNLRLVIDTAGWDHVPTKGDSICVSGVCLTVVNRPSKRGAGRRLEFDAIPETLSKTTLNACRSGKMMNLEHAATMSTLLGGHIVQGHVDGVGEVVKVTNAKPKVAKKNADPWSSGYRIDIACTPALAEYLAPKGSICVDGVSLTIADIWSKGKTQGFTVALIPETLECTTLHARRPGDRVNLEMDIFAKTIVHWLKAYSKQSSGPRSRRKK